MNYDNMADLLSAISIILVILFFAVSAFEKDASEAMSERNPEVAQKENLKRITKKLNKLFYQRSIPLLVILLFIFYILLPTSVNIISTSSLSLWYFDELKTLFIFIEIGFFCLSFYIFLIARRLYKKLKENS